MLGNSSRAADIREQNRDVYLRAARREFVTSAGAESRILSRWDETDQPHKLATDAAERIETPFATRRSRQIPEQAMQYAQRFVPLDKYFAPLLLRISLARHSHPPSVSLNRFT
jgi:hypothetical protein